jgi:hypothetical protein
VKLSILLGRFFGWFRDRRRRARAKKLAFPLPRALAAKPHSSPRSLATHLLARRPEPPEDA